MSLSPESPSISTSGINAILLGFEKMGFDSANLKHKVGLDSFDLKNPDLRIDCNYATKCYAIAYEHWLTEGEIKPNNSKGKAIQNFGLEHGSNYQPLALGIIGHLVTTANTGLDALLSYERYQTVFGDGILLRFDGDPSQVDLDTELNAYVVMHSEAQTRAVKEELIDSFFVVLLNCIRLLSGVSKPLTRVSFSRSTPTFHENYTDIFGCPVNFNQEENRIVFSTHWLKEPLITANPPLYKLLEQQLKLITNKLDGTNDFIKSVRNHILKCFDGGKVDLQRVSDKLCVSPRTLQRQLKAQETGFQKLLEEVKLEFAKHQLKERYTSIDEQAYLLGYSEPSVYRKSFKRWTGMTPSEYRNKFV